MPEFNADKILNGSPKKVLMREYANLKNEYTKMNTLKYKALYVNKPLSFILENSRYIFSEPMKGLSFYKEVIEEAAIPYPLLLEESEKVASYVEELKRTRSISKDQVALYESLETVVESRVEKEKITATLYENIMEDVENVYPIYDALYEYETTESKNALDIVDAYIESADTAQLMDVIALSVREPYLQSGCFQLLTESYKEEPITTDDYRRNTLVTCIVSRMLQDPYYQEAVNAMTNTNLRHVLLALGENTSVQMLEDLVYEEVHEEPIYIDPENAVNKIFNDRVYEETYREIESEERLHRYMCEKEILNMNLTFLQMDQVSDLTYMEDSLVESVMAIWDIGNDKTFTYTMESQMDILESYLNVLENDMYSVMFESTDDVMEEKYFSSDGGPSRIVAQSVGLKASDDKIGKKEDDKKDEEKKTEKPDLYVPHKDDDEDDEDDEDEDDEDDDDLEDEEEDEEVTAAKASKKKADKTAKYAAMDEEDLPSLTEDAIDDEIKEKYLKVDKPEKKNVFQRIQNRALDFNVQFKKKVAKGKRTSVDAKNAAKASAKIPLSVTDQIKKTMAEWDEMDDDKRKAYIIKPGVRKKYFKALRLCIMHYGAFAINPVLNVVLAICQKFSRDKDVRIRNELLRELRAEIKVVEEKIEDAKSADDKKQKYQLMRIKEKLDAEVVRIMTNSKFV